MYRSFFKRMFDLIISLIGLISFFPILLIVIFLLMIANQGKPFFFQLRPGKNQKLFKIIKFKIMTDAKDANGNLLLDAERMTKILCA